MGVLLDLVVAGLAVTFVAFIAYSVLQAIAPTIAVGLTSLSIWFLIVVWL